MPITAGSTPDAPRSVLKGGQLGKDEFLQLLVSQLRNQDPLNPTDPKDFAAQLAQFSTVEQLINMGDQLAALAANDDRLLQTIHASSALQLIGRSIFATGDHVVVPESGDLSVTVDVANQGGTAEVVLYDDRGTEVGRVNVPRLEGGRQTIDLSELVGRVEPGHYSYAVEVRTANGDPVRVQTYSRLRVDGLKYTPNGPVLTSGPIRIPLGAVIEIGE